MTRHHNGQWFDDDEDDKPVPKSKQKRIATQKPLADQLAELVESLVPAGHIYTGAQRGKFDSLYRELSKIDERGDR